MESLGSDPCCVNYDNTKDAKSTGELRVLQVHKGSPIFVSETLDDNSLEKCEKRDKLQTVSENMFPLH